MKTRHTITKVITLAIAVSALAVIGSSRAAGRTGTREITVSDGSVKFITAPIGFIPGQTLRFSAGNLSTEEEGSQPVRVEASVYDSLGNLLSRTDPVPVPAGHVRAFDFKREDLLAVGEPNTARLQMRAVIKVSFSDGSVRHLPEQFPISMELMESRTGATVIVSKGEYFAGSITVSDD